MQAISVIFAAFSLGCTVQDMKDGAVRRLTFVIYGLLLPAVLAASGCARMIPTALLKGLYGAVLFAAARKLSRNRMGLADIWYAAAGAGTLGFFEWHAAMLAGCLAALVYAAAAGKKKIPLIPFMSLGCTGIMAAEAILKKGTMQ